MKSRLLLISSLTLGLGTASLAAPSPSNVDQAAALQPLQTTVSKDCKPRGDGTFTEMVTTMASVLSPTDGIRLLDTYCEPCMKQKFGLLRP